MTEQSDPPATAPASRRRSGLWIAAAVLSAIAVFNLSVWAPAASALSKDSRNADAAQVHVYRSWLIHPRDITIDLVSVDTAAPVDLMRALFQVAATMKGRKFGRVTLARQGRPVYQMSGEDFTALGQAYDANENPVYLIRTLPESLKRPDGTEAFGTWTGGWLGVLSRQMEDVNAFAQGWVEGEAPARAAY
jgi:hypothetical protein